MNSKLFYGSVAFAAIAFAFVAPSARAAAATPPDAPVLIDTSASAGSVVEASPTLSPYTADHAFDGNWSNDAGRWLALTSSNPMYLVYKFNVATKVNMLRLRIPSNNSWDKRSPKAWTFSGSNDGSTWTQLDARSGVSWSAGEVKTVSFPNDTAYEYYKFNCTAIIGSDSYMMLWEIQFLDAPPSLVDLTSPSGTITTTTSGDWVNPAKNAFDNGTAHNNDDRSIHSGTTVDWIYTFDTPTKVNAYRVFAPGTGCYNYDKRMPKTWTFEAKKAADATWAVLDTQSSETGWKALEKRYYAFVNNTAYDSYRFAVTAYQSGSDDYVQIDELEFYYINADAPSLGVVGLDRTGAAAYDVFATMNANSADLSWIANDGATASTNLLAAGVAEGASVTNSLSGLSANTTYQISVLATNASGTAEAVAGTLYTGELSLGATTDANEYNCVTGGVVVSRASADPFPLTVNYTISGSAGSGGTTWVAPVAVTIPASAANAFLPVVPLMDGDVTDDITITVTLAAGNYEIPSTAYKTLTLYNLAAPAGKKTWVATANGNASDGANWIPAGPPTESDHILFDGAFSTARCTWDSAATHTVASWEQTVSYTASGQAGVIDFYTTYEDGDFPALAITGDCIVNGGKWTHTPNSTVQTNRLSITVGGDFTLGAGAEITASNKGYAQNKYPVGAAIGVHGGSVNNLSKVYGDFRHPIDIGAGGGSEGSSGGGAIHIVVAGAATVNGNISAQANKGSGTNVQLGAGGSIYLQAASVAGSGYISAAGYGDNDTRQFGAGGRIAVVCTTATTLDYDRSKFRCNGSIGSYGQSSGGGTIFVKTASQDHGTLIVANSVPNLSYVRWWPTKRGVTPIPTGESWELDSIEFRGQGILCVPEGTSLTVPLSGISSTNGERTGGILYEGGTLDFGSAPYTLSGNWTFCADAPYTFDGDVTVTNGANFGGFKLAGHYTNDFAKCDVTVDGNLTIASGGYASVELAGPSEANGNAECGGGLPMHGGQYAGQTGNKCYGSVFEPAYPGHFAQSGDHGSSSPGGGVLNLSVLGDMVVNGTVSANAVRSDSPSAAAGSINIVAKSLSGTGTITADGKPGGNVNSNQGYNGVGGRIAVRVTEQDVGETDIWTTFSARGIATNQVSSTSANNRNASAGTIYLQGKSDGEKGGTIYVKNQASYNTSDVATWLPAGTLGDDAKDFAKSKLVIADRGVVAIGADVKFASVSIAANSKLDLHGQKVRVASATLGGTKLAAGTYTSASGDVSGFVVDSVGGGSLTVGGGFHLIVR